MKKDLIDQTAHFIAAIAIIAPILIFPNPITAMLVGLAIGLVRELTEEGHLVSTQAVRAVLSSKSSLRDIAFWGLGGLTAGLFFA